MTGKIITENNISQKETQALSRFRSRWRRWLGQMCKDENYTRLLDSGYQTILRRIRRNHNLETERSREAAVIKSLWSEAISIATLEELQLLEIAFVNEKLNL